MLKRIKALINKPKEKRIAKKEEIRKKLPKNSFSKKFYGFSKDLKKETIVIKLPTGKIIYQKECFKDRALIPWKLLYELKKKGVPLNKCTLIHNHTIPKNSDLNILPSVIDVKAFLKLYNVFKITNYSILLIDEKSMQEFGRCFINLASINVKKEIENLKSNLSLNLWYDNRTRWFGKESLFLTIKDLERLGFKIRLQGLNGYKYDPKTRKFKLK